MQVLNLEKTQSVCGAGDCMQHAGANINRSERTTLNYIMTEYGNQASGSAAQTQWMNTWFEAYAAFDAS